MAIQFGHFLPRPSYFLPPQVMSHSGSFLAILTFFRLAACGLGLKGPEFYISRAYSNILRELLKWQGVGEQKSESPHEQ